MKNIFITGSTNNQGTPNYKLQQELKQILDSCMQRNDHIIIGDRMGVEAMAQGYLNGKHYPNVTVVHLNKQPRILTNPDWNKEHIFTPELAPDGSRMFERQRSQRGELLSQRIRRTGLLSSQQNDYRQSRRYLHRMERSRERPCHPHGTRITCCRKTCRSHYPRRTVCEVPQLG